MKILGKFAVLGAALAASVSIASATSITLGSYSTGSTNPGYDNSALALTGEELTGTFPGAYNSSLVTTPSSSSTYTLSAGSVWSAPVGSSSWVGEAANAGPGGVNPAYGYYVYTTTFSASAGLYSALFDVLADDTVEVLLNGSVIIPFGGLGTDITCADNDPTCTRQDIVSLTGLDLLSGTNTLTFIVEQAGTEQPGTDPSGVDFEATLTPTPEPSSLILMGTGLVGVATAFFRRRRSNQSPVTD